VTNKQLTKGTEGRLGELNRSRRTYEGVQKILESVGLLRVEKEIAINCVIGGRVLKQSVGIKGLHTFRQLLAKKIGISRENTTHRGRSRFYTSKEVLTAAEGKRKSSA